MTTPFEQSDKKVLKKCEECGIYPSVTREFHYYAGKWEFEYFCPKCGAYIIQEIYGDHEEEAFKEARLGWNVANGLDKYDESTWHD